MVREMEITATFVEAPQDPLSRRWSRVLCPRRSGSRPALRRRDAEDEPGAKGADGGLPSPPARQVQRSTSTSSTAVRAEWGMNGDRRRHGERLVGPGLGVKRFASRFAHSYRAITVSV